MNLGYTGVLSYQLLLDTLTFPSASHKERDVCAHRPSGAEVPRSVPTGAQDLSELLGHNLSECLPLTRSQPTLGSRPILEGCCLPLPFSLSPELSLSFSQSCLCWCICIL